MKVIRFEHKNTSKGLYSCSDLRERLEFDYTEEDIHPVPSEDTKLVKEMREKKKVWDTVRFGFANAKQALRWFYHFPDYKNFEEYGIRVAIYDVPPEHVCVGVTQVVFDDSFHDGDARKASYTPTEFWKKYRKEEKSVDVPVHIATI